MALRRVVSSGEGLRGAGRHHRDRRWRHWLVRALSNFECRMSRSEYSSFNGDCNEDPLCLPFAICRSNL
ncbi:MAG: hypothetical protein ABEK75_09985 [Salinibacter sp.]